MVSNQPIKIFIGTSANGEDADAEMVYEQSLLVHNKNKNLDITWMRLTDDEESWMGEWDTRQWPTPFSGFRWGIPEACKFSGRAIYTDVDMINFRDIQELWDTDMEGKAIAARRGERFGGHEFCVMLIDCKRLGELLPPIARMKVIPGSHFRMINQFSNNPIVHDLDPRWNILDGENYKIEEMYQVHFTKMATQPWRPPWYTGEVLPNHSRPDLVTLWYQLRNEALERGVKPYQPNIDYPAFGKYEIIGK